MTGGLMRALTDPEFRARSEIREAVRKRREAQEAVRAEAEANAQAEMAQNERILASEFEAHFGELVIKADVSPEAAERFIEILPTFAQWCEATGVPWLPDAASTVATFLWCLWRDGKSLDVIQEMAKAIQYAYNIDKKWLDHAYINAAVERISELHKNKTVH